VHLWNTTAGQQVFAYQSRESQGEVLALAWSPDSKRLASASTDGTVHIWGILTGKLLWTNRGHRASMWAVSWSPDGKHLAAVNAGDVVQLWNATTGKQVRILHL
jgi:eukaryotic-like serine/threonine-protein kinase